MSRVVVVAETLLQMSDKKACVAEAGPRVESSREAAQQAARTKDWAGDAPARQGGHG